MAPSTAKRKAPPARRYARRRLRWDANPCAVSAESPVRRQCRNTADVPPYAREQDTHAQEERADSEVDAEEFIALRGGIRNEDAGDDEHARGAREERRAEIDEPEDNDHGSRPRAATFAARPGPRGPAPAAQAETGAAAAILVDAQRHFGWLETSSTLTTRSSVVNWTHWWVLAL